MNEAGVKNYMEVLVQNIMPSVLKQLDICKCDRCQLDIFANVLNQLPPKYVVTKKGQLYTKLSSLQHQFDVDIIAAVTKAANLIGGNPRHDD